MNTVATAVPGGRTTLDGDVSIVPGTTVGPDVAVESGVTLRGTVDLDQAIVG